MIRFDGQVAIVTGAGRAASLAAVQVAFDRLTKRTAASKLSG